MTFVSRADSRVYNGEFDLRDLKKLVGKYAYNQLRKGKAILNVWRGTTPYNVFVEGKRKTLWHSDHGECPPMNLFEEIESSKEIISHNTLHRDGGRPFLTVYKLKSNYTKLKVK